MQKPETVQRAILNELTDGLAQVEDSQILRLAQAVREAPHILVQGKAAWG